MSCDLTGMAASFFTSLALKVIITTLIAVSGLIVVLYFSQDRLIFPAPHGIRPQAIHPSFKTVSISTPDSETLFALHHPDEANQATILVFHGNADAALFQQPRGVSLAQAGFGVLLIEYRGYPGSTGKPSEKGLIIDGLAAFDFIRSGHGGDIGVYASSLGTGIAIPLAAERDVFAMVLESPFDSIQAIARNAFPWIPMGLLLKHKFRSDDVIGRVDAPLLIIHGSADSVIPIEHGKALFDLAPAGSRFMEIPGAGHNNLSLFGTTDAAIRFFREKLGIEPPNEPQSFFGSSWDRHDKA